MMTSMKAGGDWTENAAGRIGGDIDHPLQILAVDLEWTGAGHDQSDGPQTHRALIARKARAKTGRSPVRPPRQRYDDTRDHGDHAGNEQPVSWSA